MATWIILALIFPALGGVINIIDKLQVDRFTPKPYYFVFWVSVIEFAIGSSMLLIVLSMQDLDVRGNLGGLIAGTITTFALVSMLSGLKRGQVARLIPIRSTYPLVVVPAAAIFLGERLDPLELIAVGLAVIGGILVSWQKTGYGSRNFGDPLAILFVFVAACLMGLSLIVSKYALDGGEMWQFYASYRLGIATGASWIIFMNGNDKREAISMISSKPFISLTLLAEVVVSIAFVIRFIAISLGPISLIAAIGSIQPTMVLLYSMILSKFAPATFGHWITKGTMKPQIAGIASITAGLVIIALV
jgi:drug/metabolite transporter (DMT)-like permease